LQIAAVLSLKPRGLSAEHIHVLRAILSNALSEDLVKSIIDHAMEHAGGHERSLFQHLYAQLDETTTEEVGKDVRQSVVMYFKNMIQHQLEEYCAATRTMDIQSRSDSPLELSCSMEIFWEDELSIMGMTSRDKSKDGLWISDEVKKNLHISHV
jgi:hypothetical protein